MPRTFWVETLGCPKNQVDSDKLGGLLVADGLLAAGGADQADVVVVNTCAFVEEARQESIDTVLALSRTRAPGAQVVVTGCLAERYGDELADALPEVDLVAGFGQAVLPPVPSGDPMAARPSAARAGVAVTISAKPSARPRRSRVARPSTCWSCPDRPPPRPGRT